MWSKKVLVCLQGTKFGATALIQKLSTLLIIYGTTKTGVMSLQLKMV